MCWYFKKNNETPTEIEIGYSFEKNDTCDGVILYNKESMQNTVKQLSQGSVLFNAERGFQFIHRLIREGLLTEKVFNVRTG